MNYEDANSIARMIVGPEDVPRITRWIQTACTQERIRTLHEIADEFPELREKMWAKETETHREHDKRCKQ